MSDIERLGEKLRKVEDILINAAKNLDLKKGDDFFFIVQHHVNGEWNVWDFVIEQVWSEIQVKVSIIAPSKDVYEVEGVGVVSAEEVGEAVRIPILQGIKQSLLDKLDDYDYNAMYTQVVMG